MRVIGVIPARWASTRFEGKVLAEIAGKPMIQHVYERVKHCSLIDEVVIACDDERIVQAAQNFDAQVVMTSVDHVSGSDRIAEVVENLDVDIVVNIQGDEPLVDSKLVDNLVRVLMNDSEAQMATVIKKIHQKDEFENPNVVKVVIDQDGHALYFSRAPIPFNRDGDEIEAYKHLGLYAYTKNCLLEFTQLPKSPLEELESLEQLRALEDGFTIKTLETDIETVGVDTPEDLEKVKQLIK